MGVQTELLEVDRGVKLALGYHRSSVAESLGNGRYGCAGRPPYFWNVRLLGSTDNAAPPTSP